MLGNEKSSKKNTIRIRQTLVSLKMSYQIHFQQVVRKKKLPAAKKNYKDFEN